MVPYSSSMRLYLSEFAVGSHAAIVSHAKQAFGLAYIIAGSMGLFCQMDSVLAANGSVWSKGNLDGRAEYLYGIPS